MSTPNWVSEQGGQTQVADSINQNLGTHSVTEIYNGSLVDVIRCGLGSPGPQALNNTSIAQPWTASVTGFNRILVPLYALGNGADVTVSIQTDGVFTSSSSTTYTSTTAQDSLASWTVNQWAGLVVMQGGIGGHYGQIISNTTNTLTILNWHSGTPTNGTVFVIAGPSGTLAGAGTQQVVVPKEFLATNSNLFPDYYPPALTPFVNTSNAPFGPPAQLYPFTGSNGFTDGNWYFLIGGFSSSLSSFGTFNGTFTNLCFGAQMAGAATTWTQFPSVPAPNGGVYVGNVIQTPSTGIAFSGCCVVGETAVVVGGLIGIMNAANQYLSTGNVSTATISQMGISSWVQAPVYPDPNASPVWGSTVAGVGPATTGTEIGSSRVYCIGGTLGGVVSTPANSASSGQPNITFATAPTGFYNGQVVNLDPNFVGHEVLTISSGAGTGTWTMTSNLVNNHGSGFLVVGTASTTSAVYSAPITNGSMGAWRTDAPLPTAQTLGVAVVVNGWLVVICGDVFSNSVSPPITPVANVYAAKINTDNTLGPWLTWPSLPSPELEAGFAVYNDTIYVLSGFSSAGNPITGQAIQALTVGQNGPASTWTVYDSSTVGGGGGGDLSLQFACSACLPANVDSGGVATVLGQYQNPTATGQIGGFGNMPMVSVPINVTGLTIGTQYNIVVSGAANNATDSANVFVGPQGTFTQQALMRTGSGGWTSPFPGGLNSPLTNTTMQVWFYSGTNGRVVHTVEDVSGGIPARWTWIIYDNLSSTGAVAGTGIISSPTIRAIGEVVGSTRDFTILNYDSSGTLVNANGSWRSYGSGFYGDGNTPSLGWGS